MKSLKEQVKDLESSRAKDFDPEDDSARRADEDDSEIEDQVNGDAGREHYEPVGKSILREPESHPLDSKYGGVAVSRRALEEEEEDDPFAPVEEFDEEDPFAARNGETKAGEEPDVSIDKDADVDEDEEIDSDEALGESDVERFKDFTFRGSRKNRIDAQSQDDLSDEENESTGSEEQST
ncbi:rRNA-processing protein bfr2, partial [Exophiala xenobiotica]